MTDFESIQLTVTPRAVRCSPASVLRAIPALILVALLLFLSTAPTTVVAGIARTPASHAFAVAPHAREPMPRPPEAARGKGKGKEKSIEQRVREKFPTWRGEELNKVLREVERRDPARGNKLLKEGLSAHEGGAHDGHTIRRHVAVSAKHLEARIEYEKRRAADRKGETRKDHEALKMEHISSFTSLKEANRLVDRALTDANNSATLKKWARDRAFVDPKTGSKQLLELTLRDAGSVTGLAMDPKSKELVEARGVRVLLRRSNGKHGWSIVTAHPVVKAEAAGERRVRSDRSRQDAEVGRKDKLTSEKIIETPYGPAKQGRDAASLAARKKVEDGAVLYRVGTTGKSEAAEAQFWALEHPMSKGYAERYGIPAENVRKANFIEMATVKPGVEFVTRRAPGVGKNRGGGIEVVVSKSGVNMKGFHTLGESK